MADIRNISLKNNTKLTINGKDYYPKYQECQDGIIELSGSATNPGVIILPDNALEGIHPYKNILSLWIKTSLIVKTFNEVIL